MENVERQKVTLHFVRGKIGKKFIWVSRYNDLRVGLCYWEYCPVCQGQDGLIGFDGGPLEVQIELRPTRVGTYFYLAHLVRVAPEVNQATLPALQFADGVSEVNEAGLTAICYVDQETKKSLLVDCGAPFSQNEPQPEAFQRIIGRSDLCGGVITHGHFDHISLFGQMPPELPMRMDPLAAVFIRKQQNYFLRQMNREGSLPLVLRQPRAEEIYEPGSTFEIGSFRIQSILIAHSIPSSSMLLIQLPSGKRILHTGDFKFNGMGWRDKLRLEISLEEIGQQGVDLMYCDNLNAHLPGLTPEEHCAVQGVAEIMIRAPGRVVVVLFASNLDRIKELTSTAMDFGRPIWFAGSGMFLSRELLSRDKEQMLIVGGEPVERTVVFATGCQAEGFSVMHRELVGGVPQLWLRSGDTVIFSSRVIPGNEGRVKDLIERLLSRGVQTVVHEGEMARLGLPQSERLKEAFVHVSGHGQAEDIRLAMKLVRPKCAVPAVRTSPQIEAFREIAASLGIEVLVPEDPHHIIL